MTTDDLIDELLVQWQELRAQGKDVTAEALCQGRPDLVPAVAEGIRKLKKFDALQREADLRR